MTWFHTMLTGLITDAAGPAGKTPGAAYAVRMEGEG
jgi:hypothetical protein